MQAWSDIYSNKTVGSEVLECYTLLSIPDFEEKLRQVKVQYDIDSYLTGLAGGVRYAPIVRYNKVSLLIHEKNVKKFMQLAECKTVDSGANVQIIVANSDELIYDYREQNGDQVASPVQIYLDCMKNKRRGEEIAEAVLAKKIEK